MKQLMYILQLEKRLKDIGKRIYQQGEESYRKGLDIEDNPWKETLHEYYAWKNGFIAEQSKQYEKNVQNS